MDRLDEICRKAFLIDENIQQEKKLPNIMLSGSLWHVFVFYPGNQITLVKRKMQITRTSIVDMVDFMMAQTGINRQQATIAFDTIVHYIKQNPRDPINKVVSYLFGQDRENGTGSLN